MAPVVIKVKRTRDMHDEQHAAERPNRSGDVWPAVAVRGVFVFRQEPAGQIGHIAGQGEADRPLGKQHTEHGRICKLTAAGWSGQEQFLTAGRQGWPRVSEYSLHSGVRVRQAAVWRQNGGEQIELNYKRTSGVKAP